MSNQIEKQFPQQQSPDNSGIIPSSKFVLEKLGIDSAEIKFIKPRWKRSCYRAIFNWLTKYQLFDNISNLEKVRGLTEAFYHLCEINSLQQASEILFAVLNTPTKEQLHNQL
ncbi:hypothetical protein NJ959_29960, partial [Symplocastrum sp. BBK-W-15]